MIPELLSPPPTTPAVKLPNMDERSLPVGLSLSSNSNKSRPYRISKALKEAEVVDAIAREGESPPDTSIIEDEVAGSNGYQRARAQSTGDSHHSGDESESAGGVELGLGISVLNPEKKPKSNAPTTATEDVADGDDGHQTPDSIIQEDTSPHTPQTPREGKTDLENPSAQPVKSDTSPTIEVISDSEGNPEDDSVITEIGFMDPHPLDEDTAREPKMHNQSVKTAAIKEHSETKDDKHPDLSHVSDSLENPKSREDSIIEAIKPAQPAESDAIARDADLCKGSGSDTSDGMTVEDERSETPQSGNETFVKQENTNEGAKGDYFTTYEGSDKGSGDDNSESTMTDDEREEAGQPDDKSSTQFGSSDDGANSDGSVTSKASDKGSGSDNSSGIMIDNNGADMQYPNDKSSLEENISDGAKNDPSTMSSSSHDDDPTGEDKNLISEDEDIKTQQPTDDVSTKLERPDEKATIDALNNAIELNKTNNEDLAIETERAATQKPNTNTGVRPKNSDDEAENDPPTSNDAFSNKSVDNNTSSLAISNSLPPTQQTSDSTSTEEEPSKGEEGDRNVSTTDSFSDLDGNIFHEMRPLIKKEKEHIELQKPSNDITFSSENPHNKTENDAPTSISPSSGNDVNKTDNEGLTMQNQHLAAHEVGNDASVQVLEEADGNLPTTGSFSSSDRNIIDNEHHPIEREHMEGHEPSDDASIKSENPDHAVQEYSPEINPSESKSDGDEDIRRHIVEDECDGAHEPSDYICIKDYQAPNEVDDEIDNGDDEDKDSEDTNFKDNFSEIHPCDDDEFVEEQAFDEGAESEEPGSSSEDDSDESDDECIVIEEYTKPRHSSEETSSDRQTGDMNEEVDEAATEKAAAEPLPSTPEAKHLDIDYSEHTDSCFSSDDPLSRGDEIPDEEEQIPTVEGHNKISNNEALTIEEDGDAETQYLSQNDPKPDELSPAIEAWDVLPKTDDDAELEKYANDTSKRRKLDSEADPTTATRPEIKTQQQSQNPHMGSSANSADSQGSNAHDITKGNAHPSRNVSASKPKRDARAAVQADLDALRKKMKAEEANKYHGPNDGSTHVDGRKQEGSVETPQPPIESSPQEGDPIQESGSHKSLSADDQADVYHDAEMDWKIDASCHDGGTGTSDGMGFWHRFANRGLDSLMKVHHMVDEEDDRGVDRAEPAGVVREPEQSFISWGIDLLLDAMSYSIGV